MTEVGSLRISLGLESVDFSRGMRDINNRLRALDSEMKAAMAGAGRFDNSIDALTNRQNILNRTMQVHSARVQELRRKYEDAARTTGETSQQTLRLAAQYNNAVAAMRQTEDRLNLVNRRLEEANRRSSVLSQSLNRLGDRMQAVGGRMQAAGSQMATTFGMAFAAVGGALGLTAKKAMDFESQMSSVYSVMSPDEVNKFGSALEGLAEKMGAETKFSSLEAAQGIEELIKAGVTVTDIMNGGLQGALSLAVAGELELADAAEVASTALNAFKTDNLSVVRAADLLAGAANASATSVSEMKFGLSMVSAVASGVGLSFKDTTTALAAFAQNGLKGSDAGTSLKTMLLNLSPSTEGASTEMDKLGLLTEKGTSAFYNANGSIKSMAEIAELLKTKLANLTDEQRQMALKTMFGTDAIRAANILYKEGASGINNMAGAMEKIKSADVAATKLDNVKGRLELLKGSLESAAISIGGALLPAIDKIIAVVQNLTDKFNNLSPEMQKNIVIAGMVATALLGIGTAIGVTLAVVGATATGIGAIATTIGTISGAIAVVTTGAAAATPAVGGLAAAFTVLTGPIGLTVAGIAALTIAGIAFYKHLQKDVIPEVDRFGEGVSKNTQKALEGYFKLSDGASQKLQELNLKQQYITEETKNSLVDKFSQMNDQILSKMNERHTKQIESMQNYFANSNALTVEEEQRILELQKTNNDQAVVEQQFKEDRIKEILTKAASEKRQLTDMEKFEINNLQKAMNENAVQYLAKNELEAKVIMERMKQTAGDLSARQAAEVVKNSNKQKDEAVKAANEQYDKTIAEIIKMRDESGVITAEQADKMIEEATRQRNVTVGRAEETHQKVVSAAKKQAGEHIDTVDWQTGEVLSKWESFKKNTSQKWDEMTSAASKKWESMNKSISKKVDEMKSDVDAKMKKVKDVVEEKFEKAKDYLESIDLSEIGRNIIEGLINGIGEKASSLKSKVEELASNIPEWARKMLGIHSPSRVMMEVGRWTGEGLAKGLDNSKGSVKASTDNILKDLIAFNGRIASEMQKNKAKQDAITTAQIESSKNWYEKKKYYNQLSLADELRYFEYIATLTKTNSEERAQAEREIYRVKKEINNQIASINNDYVQKMEDANRRLAESEKALTDQYNQAVESRTKSLISFTGLFDKVREASEVTGQELIDNLRGQVSTFSEWAENISSLSAKGIDQGLLEDLRAMGPAAYSEIAALNSLTAEQLAEYSSLWLEKNQLARTQATTELEGLKKETNLKIKELRAQTANELNSYKNEWLNKIKEIRTGTTNEFVKMNTSLKDIGMHSIQGLMDGMKEMQGPLMAQAKAIADAISKTIKSALQIKSPSRVTMRLGEFVGEGLLVGMNATLGDIQGISAKLAAAAIPNIDTQSWGQAGQLNNPVDAGGKYGKQIEQYITIQSPTPLSPSENARKMKQAARELAMEWGM